MNTSNLEALFFQIAIIITIKSPNQMIQLDYSFYLSLKIMFVKHLFFLTMKSFLYFKQKFTNIEKIHMRKQTKAKQNPDTVKTDQSCTLFQGDTELGKKVNQFLNGGTYAIITTFVMIYSLFSDDIRQICFPLSADLGFSIATLICMIFYGIEIVVFSLVQKDYFLKYYFWLDLVSTLTMAFDLIWITQYLIGGGKSAANISQISKASRAARLGTRTVRLIRLIRMIKLIKQMKLISKDLNKTHNQIKAKKVSQRLSSIHSKIVSQKHLEKANSLHHAQRIPSKRWSVIKDLQCVGVHPNVQAPAPVMSTNCLPYENKDEIIDKQSVSNASQIQKVEVRNHKDKTKLKSEGGSVRNVVIPVFQETKEEAKHSDEKQQQSKCDKKNELLVSKKSKFQKTNKKITLQQANSQEEIQIPPESKVGAKVQQEVQKNIILLIILILISIPLLDGTTWSTNTTVYDKGQSGLLFYATYYPQFYQTLADNYILKASINYSNKLLYFSITTTNGFADIFPDNYSNYKGTEQNILASTRLDDIYISSGNGYLFHYSISQYNRTVSIFNIVRTIFVCILLIITTILFSNDLDQIAVLPLQEMMETVKKMAINPLNAIKQIQLKKLCLEKLEEEEGKIQKTEPIVLQNTIVKIGSLLAVGFGEAGTEIICRVIEDPSIINVMIPGKKIMAIFGFCDIRNFTDATQVLQADVMVFVNEIAAICHKTVYEHLGSPNKNIGDAFLLVWKFANQDIKTTETNEYTKLQLVKSTSVSQKADLAVLGLIRMIAEMTRAECLQKYKKNRGLQQRIPNYGGVKMGFGLHMGWAIEGPIGSEYKIDASYLGPDVHMASRLQAATKGYGAHMLITDSVYNIMTQNKRYLRKIDQVIPEGEEKKVDLFTVDLQPYHLFDELGITADKVLDKKQKRLMKIYQNNNRKKLEQDIAIQGSTNALWNDQQIKIMQEIYTQRFYAEWQKGFEAYINGKWEQALQYLTQASALGPKGTDGPSQSLIKFIQENKGQTPEDWKGYRRFE